MDSTSRTQTEVKFVHGGFVLSWFCFVFMVDKMNFAQRSVPSGLLVACVVAAAAAIWSGFVLRKTLFKRSADALPDNVGEALRRWKGANIVSFSNAMSVALFGAVLRFLGSSWYVAGTLFGLSLGLLLLWRPRQMAANNAQLRN